MPWRHTAPMDQTRHVSAAYLRQSRSIREVWELSGVSRTTGDPWIERSRAHGPQGLEERSRQPPASPQPTPRHVVDAFRARRRHHPTWGATKRLFILQIRPPRWPLPARATVWAILRRHGVVPKTRPRWHSGHPGKPTRQIRAPNDVWGVDCKDYFHTGSGISSNPLTVADGDSRVRLDCPALSSTRGQEAQPVLTRVCQELGPPKRCHTDTGVPCAPTPLARLSQLSAWGVRLSLLPECIDSGKPQPNGRHERLHRTLQAGPPRPLAATRHARLPPGARFRYECHFARPHEALDRHTPAARDEVSPREMLTQLPRLAESDRFEGRDGSTNGGIRWHQPGGNVSHTSAGADVGLDAIDDGLGKVHCGPRTLGRLRERPRLLEEASDRLTRCR
jgi:hypothetical protein